MLRKHTTLDIKTKFFDWNEERNGVEATKKDIQKIEKGDYLRADGDCICTKCKQAYKNHPYLRNYKWLNKICTGLLVKL